MIDESLNVMCKKPVVTWDTNNSSEATEKNTEDLKKMLGAKSEIHTEIQSV